MEYFLIAVLSQSLLILSLFQKEIFKKDSEKFLWYIILIAAFILLLKFLFLTLGAEMLYKSYSPAVSLAIASLLYMYVQSIVKNETYPRRKIFFHLLPTIILTITFFVLGLDILFNNNYSWIGIYKNIYDVVFICINFIYYPFILFLLVFNKDKLYNTLQWLIVPISIWIIALVVLFSIKYCNAAISVNYFLYLILLGFTIFLIRVLRNKYLALNSNEILLKSQKSELPKYEKSSLKDEDTNKILYLLQTYMNEKKPYTDSDFSLTTLSTQLNISKHHITEVLNTSLRKNFFLFVNEYRTQEAKNRMSKNRNEQLQTIAHFSGFNSKTTFIKYFKQIEGITPSEFRKNLP